VRAKRREILGRVKEALRRQSGATVLFHAAVADRLGLHASDHKCLDLLVRLGPKTAGELAEQTGLTTGAITGVIDRLEGAGYARRAKDPADRRRVVVEPVGERAASEIGPVFEGIARATDDVCSRYSDAELELVIDFLTRCGDIAEAQAALLARARPGGRGD
jgi:DNA-binding MarR family transcriptional regulator